MNLDRKRTEEIPSLVGQRLGLYQVEELIGAGGMGEVYRAQDTRLQRAVALKVLPPSSSLDPERLARLQREARMLAALNHPNIAMIHGLEEVAGTRVLVLELVEGETVAERLKRGRIPLEETLELGRQIAEGLEAAHEKGVIHRDLKPANIKITPEGKCKILDFGLAKATQRGPATADPTQSPTVTDEMSHPGMILGTAAYMSPEQAMGKPVDKRTDIWAFGCVLYECLTAGRAFQGGTITEILAAVLKSELDWQELPPDVPWRVKELLRRCLQKDPKQRLHDIADARIALQEQREAPTEPPQVAQRLSPGAQIATGMALLGLGVLVGAASMRYLEPAAPRFSQSTVRSTVRLEPGHWLDGGRLGAPYAFEEPTRTAMAISSDGRFLVYSAIKESPSEQDRSCLYLRRLDQLEAKPIPGTEGGSSPFLSPDDHWVGFWADSKLKKVPVEGGVPAALCDVTAPWGCSWGTDNQIVFASGRDSGLSRISAAGGEIEILTKPEKSKEEYAHRLPCCLPGAKAILFTVVRQPWDAQPRVALLDLATRKWRVLLENAADARYVPAGYFLFLRQGTLLAVPFDLQKLAISGQPVPAAANIAQAINTGHSEYETAAGQYSLSASGSLVYASSGMLPDRQNSLVWVDRQGKAEPIASFKAPFLAPRLSPDGQRIAYATFGLERCIWIYDLNRGTATKLTADGVAGVGVWSPDGRTVAFGWFKTDVRNIYSLSADGGSPMERLTKSEYVQSPGSWSPDGQTLAFVEERPETKTDILSLNIRDRQVTPFLNSGFREAYPEFSPDGHWIAYVSDESGRRQVYVRSWPAGKGKLPISSEGGTEPIWARNGKELLYRSGALGAQTPSQVWAVEVNNVSGFSAGKPKRLFDQPGYAWGSPTRGWDISPDGERFLMVKLEERKPRPLTEMVLVQNWMEEVHRLAPTKK